MSNSKPTGAQLTITNLLRSSDKVDGEPTEVTLYCKGVVVSGYLVSTFAWLQEVFSNPHEDATPEEREDFDAKQRVFGRKRAYHAIGVEKTYHSLVVKDALVIAGSYTHSTESWQGNIDAIDGLEYGLHYMHPHAQSVPNDES